MSDEEIRLILNMGGSSASVEDVKKKLESLKTTVQSTADTYEVLMGDLGTYEVLARRVQTSTADVAQANAGLESTLVRIHPNLTKLGGDYSRSGGGLLGASFAAQDFVSVLSGGGGLGRALNAVSNNIPQILMGLGVGAGLAGVFSVVTALVGAGIPVIESWFGTMSGSRKDEAKQAIGEIEAEIKRVNQEFAKLRDTATGPEEERARRLKEMLGTRPMAEQVRKGIMRTGAVEGPDLGMMSDEERASYEQMQETVRAYEAAPGALSAGEKQTRDEAYFRMNLLKQEASKRRAEQVVTDMTKGGPAGDRSREELLRRARARPGFFPAGLAADIEQPPATREDQAKIEAEGRKNARQFEKERDREQEQARKQAREQANREADRLNKAAEKNKDDADKEAERRATEARRLSNQMGKAMEHQQERRQSDRQKAAQMPVGGNLPMIPEGSTQDQIRKITLESFQQLMMNGVKDRQYLMELRRVRSKLQTNSMKPDN